MVRVGFVHGYQRGRVHLLDGPADGLGQAFPAYGLQDVVDGLEVEGLHREALVGGDEDDERRFGEPGEQPCHVEPVEARHVDVEEDDVDALVAVGAALQGAVDPAQGRRGIARALDAAHPWIGVQQIEQLFEGGRFVVDGEGAQHEPGV